MVINRIRQVKTKPYCTSRLGIRKSKKDRNLCKYTKKRNGGVFHFTPPPILVLQQLVFVLLFLFLRPGIGARYLIDAFVQIPQAGSWKQAIVATRPLDLVFPKLKYNISHR